LKLTLGSTILTLGFPLKAEALSNPKGLPGAKVRYDAPGLFATEELDCFGTGSVQHVGSGFGMEDLETAGLKDVRVAG